MVGGGGGGWRNAAKRMWRAAFGWEADANAEADGTCAVERGEHHNKDTGAFSNGSSPPRKKARGDDGSGASEALVGPEGHAPSPSAAVGGPASSLPVTFPSAGFAGNATDAEAAERNAAARALVAAVNKAETRLNDHQSAHNKLTVAFNQLQTRFHVSLSVLSDQRTMIDDQRAMIDALTLRIDRCEGLRLERLQRAASPVLPIS